jgi:hypothetical protein
MQAPSVATVTACVQAIDAMRQCRRATTQALLSGLIGAAPGPPQRARLLHYSK